MLIAIFESAYLAADKYYGVTHKTKGIVLRTIKYGETSLVVTMFTELFGMQTYMVNGIRTSKRQGAKAAMYQPAAIIEMEVYHNDQKAMQALFRCLS